MDPGADGHAEIGLLRALHHRNGITAVLELHGECDYTTRPTLRTALGVALNGEPESLVIDLDQLTLCDAACAQDLLAVARLRSVGLARAHGVVARVLDLLDPMPSLLAVWAQRPLPTRLDPN